MLIGFVKRMALLGVALLFALAALPVEAQQQVPFPPYYIVVDLGTLPGGTNATPFAVNRGTKFDEMVVVGQANIGTKQVPFVWKNGVMAPIGDPATMKSGVARDVNGADTNSGKIVGEWADSLNKKHAFVFDSSGLFELAKFDATHTNTTAWGLNQQGDIVGYSWSGAAMPVRWDYNTSPGTTPTKLYFGAAWTYSQCAWRGHQFFSNQPIKINDAGHLVSSWATGVTSDCGWPPGYTLASSSVSAAVKSEDNGVTWRMSGGPPIGGCYPYYTNPKFYECADSWGVDINNLDTVVDYGQYNAFHVAGIPKFAMVSYAWFDTNVFVGYRGSFTCLADQNFVKAINDSDVAVGYHLKMDNQGTNCVDGKPYTITSVGWVQQWRPTNSGPILYLTEHIRQDCGWKRLIPTDINNAGIIVGAGLHTDGTSHGFMMIPTDTLPSAAEGCISHGDVPNANADPIANAGPDQVLEATSPAGAEVTLNGAGSSDPDNDPLTYAWETPFGTLTEVSPVLTMPLGVNTLSLTVDDGKGGTAHDTVTITVQDTTPPETTITAKPESLSALASPTFSFEGTDIVSLPETLTFECSIDGGPWLPCTSAHAYSNLAEGSHEFQVRAIDEIGNVDPTPATFMWTIDSTPPTIIGHRNPAANAYGWNNTDVMVSFTCTDGGSGLAAGSPPADTVLSIEGAGQSVTGSCSDLAGNTASATVGGINIDKTAPVTTGAFSRNPDSNGWYNHAVSITWSGSDALSGIESCSAATNYAGPDSASASVTGSCTDLAGNSSSATANLQYDATAPVILINAPGNGAGYLLGAAVASDYSCNDALSGLFSCAGPITNGANIDTASVGSKSFGVTARDVAGNVASLAHTYRVLYANSGFLQPIDNLPVINNATAGRTVPIKWRLTNASGAMITDLSSFASLLSAPIACDASPTTIVEEELVAPGDTVVRFSGDHFIFNWQTSRDWTGCRILQLSLADGSVQYAKFQFR